MTAKPPVIDYLRRQRHILLDMHIPDFDPGFLRNFDPAANVELCARAGADSVMVYCNSMTGLANWPTEAGAMHPGLQGRDVVGETVRALHERGIAACAYYSVNFNNWAYEANPSWRIQLAAPSFQFGEHSRAGLCCPASGGFRDFARAQTEEIARGYEFDAFFFDMMFWPGVCVCDNCRDRFRAETGNELPEAVDWHSPEWCGFQAARERWLHEQFTNLVGGVKAHRAIPVFNNSGLLFSSWCSGTSLALARSNDLLGGDAVPGDGLYAFGQLASRLSPNGWQYMHAGSGYVSGAVKVPSVAEQRGHAMVAAVLDGQFMAIDGVLPDGTVYPPTYGRLAEAFTAMKPHERFLGGRPVADIGVYYSPAANVDFKENGTPVAQIQRDLAAEISRPSDHIAAVWGACAALQRAHLPAGVITRADLEVLDDFAVIVLPNVLRMDQEEVAAFRRYVERGGRLYASGYTSLVDVVGVKHDDFALADVFGCHFEAPEPAIVSYLRPDREGIRAAVAPSALVPHGAVTTGFMPWSTSVTALLVNADDDAVALARLTQPYGLGRGARTEGWASIFTAPPWKDTDRPVIVEHAYGAGRAVYSACDIEAAAPHLDTAAAQSLFVALVRGLLKGPITFEADAHPNVWVVAFHEPEARRIRVNLLNHQPGAEPLPVPGVTLRLNPPEGARFTGLRRLDGGEQIDCEIDADGRLRAEFPPLVLFEAVCADYA